MSKLTKTLILSAILSTSVIAWAQTIASGNTITQTAGGGGTYTCDALNGADTVRVSVSAGNGAAFACNTANVGVGVANYKGRGNVYSIHSQGGNTIVATPNGSRFANVAQAAAAADTAAAARLVEAGT